MKLKKLMTMSFDRNVGTADRVFRMLAGAALAGAALYLGFASWVSYPIAILGAMVFHTGATSKCGTYYMLGWSTCHVRETSHDERSV